MIYDDGSTLDPVSMVSTPAPAGMLLSDYGSNFNPSNVSPGATTWSAVLANGFGRLVDYKIASMQSQNTPAQYVPTAAPAGGQVAGFDVQSLLVIGAVGLAIALALGGGRK